MLLRQYILFSRILFPALKFCILMKLWCCCLWLRFAWKFSLMNSSFGVHCRRSLYSMIVPNHLVWQSSVCHVVNLCFWYWNGRYQIPPVVHHAYNFFQDEDVEQYHSTSSENLLPKNAESSQQKRNQKNSFSEKRKAKSSLINGKCTEYLNTG